MRASNPDACEAMPWKKHRLALSAPILQSVSSTDGRSRFIFPSGRDFYLGDLASNEINRVSAALGMDSILRVLKDPSREAGSVIIFRGLVLEDPAQACPRKRLSDRLGPENRKA